MTPSACSTSAAPDFDDSARLPCLATGTPAPATMKAAQVEMLNEPEASPPVPTTSIASAGAFTPSILARMVVTAPVISSTVSPRTRKRHQQAAHLRGRRFARHHAVEGGGCLLAREARPGRDLGDERLEIVGHGVSSPARASVSRAAGWRPRCGIPRGGDVEKILQHQMAVLGGDAFGVELHAVHRQLLVHQPHDQPVVGLAR